MRRLPVAAFAVLVAATVGAFFVTQHLKSSTPLYAGFPKPNPQWINPLHGVSCGAPPVDHRATTISFYLLHRADDVDVYVVDRDGAIVRTVASGRHMRIGVRRPDGVFNWNGRTDAGGVAPDGVYHFRVALRRQGRTLEIRTQPGEGVATVTVRTVPPHPAVLDVAPSLIPVRGHPVRIHYRGNTYFNGVVHIYRTDAFGRVHLVESMPTANGARATWDGRVAGAPAPAGTYLVGFDAVDPACNVGRFPRSLPPAPGSTPRAGVTVRYLAVQPPLDPVPTGGRALVYVDSRQHSYEWSLTRTGARRAVEHGSGRAVSLRVRLPLAPGPGLYTLAVRSGVHRTEVPLVASATHGSDARRRILVVLPALSWQGENPVDDDGDGIPNTLLDGGPIRLSRPFALGLPTGVGEEKALLAYLDRTHLAYDVTTDVGLLDKVGPGLTAYRGVVLNGSERWQSVTVGSALRSYVQSGGRVASVGLDSLRRGVVVRAGVASHPSAPADADLFGVRAGKLVVGNHDLIAVITNHLGIFSTTSYAFPGYSSFAVLQPPRPPEASAGTGKDTLSIVGFGVGRGTVVEVGLAGFGSSLAHNVDAQEFIGGLWTLLGR
ncbi:MAG: FlgD immunoglobulin-like domain containing protein [Solirubrobacteraceae bacterium]